MNNPVYLSGAVGDALRKCLSELITLRPEDPIEWIALWLYRYSDNELYYYEKSVFNSELRLTQIEEYRNRETRKECKKAATKEMERLKRKIDENQATIAALKKTLGITEWKHGRKPTVRTSGAQASIPAPRKSEPTPQNRRLTAMMDRLTSLRPPPPIIRLHKDSKPSYGARASPRRHRGRSIGSSPALTEHVTESNSDEDGSDSSGSSRSSRRLTAFDKRPSDAGARPSDPGANDEPEEIEFQPKKTIRHRPPPPPPPPVKPAIKKRVVEDEDAATKQEELEKQKDQIMEESKASTKHDEVEKQKEDEMEEKLSDGPLSRSSSQQTWQEGAASSMGITVHDMEDNFYERHPELHRYSSRLSSRFSLKSGEGLVDKHSKHSPSNKRKEKSVENEEGLPAYSQRIYDPYDVDGRSDHSKKITGPRYSDRRQEYPEKSSRPHHFDEGQEYSEQTSRPHDVDEGSEYSEKASKKTHHPGDDDEGQYYSEKTRHHDDDDESPRHAKKTRHRDDDDESPRHAKKTRHRDDDDESPRHAKKTRHRDDDDESPRHAKKTRHRDGDDEEPDDSRKSSKRYGGDEGQRYSKKSSQYQEEEMGSEVSADSQMVEDVLPSSSFDGEEDRRHRSIHDDPQNAGAHQRPARVAKSSQGQSRSTKHNSDIARTRAKSVMEPRSVDQTEEDDYASSMSVNEARAPSLAEDELYGLTLATWCLDCNLGLVCDHPLLGLMRARCPIVLPESPAWWEEKGYLAETLYDPEVYSLPFEEIEQQP